MNRRGVCYDVGREMMNKNFRPEFDPDIIKHELEIIKEDLHCNVVRICGKDVKRLMKASEFALKIGLEVGSHQNYGIKILKIQWNILWKQLLRQKNLD